MIKVAILQLSTLSMSKNKIDYYLNACSKKGVKVVLLGEYVLNSFFKELESMPISMIKEQSQKQIEIARELCQKYDLTLVAPVVSVKKDKIYKLLAKFSPTKNIYKEQNFLVNYKHWNEEQFFSNEKYEQNILYFSLEGVKFAAICGFEAHFDTNWIDMLKKRVDIVLMPSVGTFESQNRWREILSAKAFLNGAYVLRANRVGEFEDKTHRWGFYGDSLFISPNGEVLSYLGKKEEMMICECDKKESSLSKKDWAFKSAYGARGMM